MLSPFCVYINCGFYELLLKSHLRKVETRKEIKENFTYQFMYSVAYIAIFTINMMFSPYYLNVYRFAFCDIVLYYWCFMPL